MEAFPYISTELKYSGLTRQEREGLATKEKPATMNQANAPGTKSAQTDPIKTARKRESMNNRSYAIPFPGSINSSEDDMPPIPDAEVSSLALDNKPGARIHYTYYPVSKPHGGHPNPFSQTLIVFLNGLMMPRSSWDPTMRSFLEKRVVGRLPYPALLTYDRYGQGDSDPDPDDQDFWPDPDAPDFNPHTLPEGVTEDEVRATREKYKRMFHPDVPSQEGLSRRNLPQLLPKADAPKLEGYLGRGPYLTVVGHDWEKFAEQSYRGTLQTPKVLTMTYANPAWRRYNGLCNITDEGRAIGPITGVRCGHFIQQDDPRFVSDEMVSLLDRVVNRVQQVSQRD